LDSVRKKMLDSGLIPERKEVEVKQFYKRPQEGRWK
jgi:hypothetical protein